MARLGTYPRTIAEIFYGLDLAEVNESFPNSVATLAYTTIRSSNLILCISWNFQIFSKYTGNRLQVFDFCAFLLSVSKRSALVIQMFARYLSCFPVSLRFQYKGTFYKNEGMLAPPSVETETSAVFVRHHSKSLTLYGRDYVQF